MGCVGAFTLWMKPFMADYYQKMANSHYDALARWIQMGPVFVVALIFSIHGFVNKRYFVGVLTVIIIIWSFYWAFEFEFIGGNRNGKIDKRGRSNTT